MFLENPTFTFCQEVHRNLPKLIRVKESKLNSSYSHRSRTLRYKTRSLPDRPCWDRNKTGKDSLQCRNQSLPDRSSRPQTRRDGTFVIKEFRNELRGTDGTLYIGSHPTENPKESTHFPPVNVRSEVDGTLGKNSETPTRVLPRIRRKLPSERGIDIYYLHVGN